MYLQSNSRADRANRIWCSAFGSLFQQYSLEIVVDFSLIIQPQCLIVCTRKFQQSVRMKQRLKNNCNCSVSEFTSHQPVCLSLCLSVPLSVCLSRFRRGGLALPSRWRLHWPPGGSEVQQQSAEGRLHTPHHQQGLLLGAVLLHVWRHLSRWDSQTDRQT